MRPHVGPFLAALVLLAAAGLAGAEEAPRRPPPPSSPGTAAPAPSAAPPASVAPARPPPPGEASSASRPPPPGTRPPPPGGARPPPPGTGLHPPPPPPPSYLYGPWPTWWGWGWGAGWGWGWGYAPVWPWPGPPPPTSPPPAVSEADRSVTTLRASGTGDDGTSGELALAVEGGRIAFRVAVAGLSPDLIDGARPSSGTDPLAYGAVTVGWSLLAEKTHRLRLEVGGSMLSIPSNGSYLGKDYAGTTAFGVLLGVSGQVGLLGPLGLEGHLRVTPYPVPVVDAGALLALRFGPLALSGGWRTLDLSGSGDHGPSAQVSGPELGLTVVF